MKNLIKTFFILVIALTTQSFGNSHDFPYAGTYGVSENDPSSIQLVLKQNQTFTYQDFSNPEKKIDIHGTWTFENNRVELTAPDATYSFHDKWKFDKEGLRAKSVKGLTFYTLVRKD